MTRDAFRDALRLLDLEIQEFSALVEMHPVTIGNWGLQRTGRDVQLIPAWVPRLLTAWLAHPDEVPRQPEA